MLRNWSGVGGVLITFLALVHMLNATQLVWGGEGFANLPCTCAHLNATQLVWGGDGFDNLPCTCAHVECYATGLGWGDMITFLALVHMLNASQLVWGGEGFDNLPCTCTHVECYATGLGSGGF